MSQETKTVTKIGMKNRAEVNLKMQKKESFKIASALDSHLSNTNSLPYLKFNQFSSHQYLIFRFMLRGKNISKKKIFPNDVFFIPKFFSINMSNSEMVSIIKQLKVV
jgi:hypothetical protein